MSIFSMRAHTSASHPTAPRQNNRSLRRQLLAGSLALTAAVSAALALTPLSATASPSASRAPLVVKTDAGRLQGVASGAVNEFRGVPFAAPPTGELRWRAPQAVTPWTGIRPATAFSPVCPQGAPSPNGSSEDCLYLNVTTPAGQPHRSRPLPVIVFIHGGGFAIGEGADYDASKLAETGAVVVTINYRLGLLGFLAHPALAEGPKQTAGNYGLMDQQAALRWVQRNVSQFGGDPHRVALAGQSAGGLSVLEQLASPGAKGLFQRAIVQSGAFAPKQKTLEQAETEGKAVAPLLGCVDQSAECLRRVPVDTLVQNTPASITPGYVDGKVLHQSVFTAVTSGEFNRVPILNGNNSEEERLFTVLGLSVTKGATTPLPGPITADNYQSTIAFNFGVSDKIAARIAREYPLEDYASPALAFSALNSDANFSTPGFVLDAAASLRVPTYAYDFNDNAAPERFVPASLGLTATHQSELQYLFDLPNAPLPGQLSSEQEKLASTMRQAWVQFAASGSPATAQQQWPAFQLTHPRVLSLRTPAPVVDRSFAARHHSVFWAGLALTTK